MELRVFISSTFRDLQEEREHLSKKVFPAIRKLCRDRGVEFTEIDLRWGLTLEEAHNGKIIRTCLEEIDKCRPYFIGIMGSRYGWVPEFHEVQRDPDLLRTYPWVEDAIVEGASILEIEFEYAALRDPEHADFAFFYARKQHANSHFHHVPEPGDQTEKLDQLKEKIRSSGLPLREFSGAETLGEHLYEDLAAAIDRNWKANEEASPLTEERRRHEAFAASRRHAYIANPKYIRTLNDYSLKEESPIAIFAPSGSGKSALLAFWAHQYKEKHPKDFLIQHFIGIGTSAGDEIGVLSHIISEIKERYAITDELPTQPEKIIGDFPLWLARVQNEQLIIVLDALNQLEDRAHHLEWLPQHIPSNIKIITSTTSEEMIAKLESKNWRTLRLEPLTIEEREAIIVRFLSEYHKGLSLEQSSRIAKDRKSASPLFLRTMLEELRLFGSFEHLQQNIENYLNCEGLDDLFQLVLERMEEDYGARTVREVMSFLWASRKGLSERELADLIPITRMRLSAFLLALDYHLHRRDGQLTFFHDYLRSAVEKRYLSTPAKKKKEHAHIGEYFSRQEASLRRADEEPWQWVEAEEWERLKNALVDVPLFEILAEKTRQYELLGYWRKLEGMWDAREEYEKVVKNLQNSTDEKKFVTIIEKLANYYLIAGKFNDAKPLLEQTIELNKRIYGEESSKTAESLDDYATLLYHKNEFHSAELNFNQALKIQSKLFGQEDHRYIKTLGNLGAVYFGKGELDKSKEIFEKSIDVTMKTDGKNHYVIAQSLHNIGMIMYQQHKYEEAKLKFEEAYSIQRELYGESNPESITMLESIGRTYGALERFQEGEKYLHKVIELSSRMLGENHPFTLLRYHNLGALYRNSGNLEEAEKFFLRAVNENMINTEDLSNILRMVNLGNFYARHKVDISKAIFYYENGLSALISIFGTKHPLTDQYLTNYFGFLESNKMDSKLNNFKEKITAFS